MKIAGANSLKRLLITVSSDTRVRARGKETEQLPLGGEVVPAILQLVPFPAHAMIVGRACVKSIKYKY